MASVKKDVGYTECDFLKKACVLKLRIMKSAMEGKYVILIPRIFFIVFV